MFRDDRTPEEIAKAEKVQAEILAINVAIAKPYMRWLDNVVIDKASMISIGYTRSSVEKVMLAMANEIFLARAAMKRGKR